MAVWSYVDPTQFSKDAVRLIIGDTEETDQLLSDAEINYFLTTEGSVSRAAPEAARAIAAKFARLMSRSIGGVQADFSAKHRQYLELARHLDDAVGSDPVAPWLSGASKALRATYDADSDREPTVATKGMHDAPDTLYSYDDDTDYRLRS